MSLAVTRAFAVAELLSGKLSGLPLHEISETLQMPKSATHRILSHMAELGYIRQEKSNDHYVLTLKLTSIGQRHLSRIPLIELAQEFLDRLSTQSGELTRLSIVDEDTMMWVAKSTVGSRSALRYDPDEGKVVHLSCAASGWTILSTLPDEEALRWAHRQPYPQPGELGPDAPRNDEEFLARLATTREQGYAYACNTFEPGIAALAVAVQPDPNAPPIGAVNVAGPSVRLTSQWARKLAPAVQQAAEDLAVVFRGGTTQAILDEAVH